MKTITRYSRVIRQEFIFSEGDLRILLCEHLKRNGYNPLPGGWRMEFNLSEDSSQFVFSIISEDVIPENDAEHE